MHWALESDTDEDEDDLLGNFVFTHDRLILPEPQIRLVRRVDSDESTRMHLRISTWTVAKAPPYNAISYVWGGAEGSRLILINNSRFYARRNAHFALAQAFLHAPDEYLWIDSICVNQNDIKEKSKQVQQMGQIFAKAQMVFLCVGPSKARSDRLHIYASTLKAIAGLKLGPEVAPGALLDDDERDNVVDEWVSQRGARHVYRALKAIEAFAIRGYWSRLWVVQEIALAQKKTILCGKDMIDWDHASTFHRIGVPSDAHFFHISVDCADSKTITLDQAVSLFSDFHCADMRDRLYGLSGLLDPRDVVKTGCEANYDLTRLDLLLGLVDSFSKINSGRVLDAMKMFELNFSKKDMKNLVSYAQTGRCLHGEEPSTILQTNFDLHTLSVLYYPCCQIDEDSAGSWIPNLSFRMVNTESISTGKESLGIRGLWVQPEPTKPYELAAWVCSGAMKGDILVGQPDHRPDNLLVLRRIDQANYKIVGQARRMYGLGKKDVDYEPNVAIQLKLTAPEIVLLWGHGYSRRTMTGHHIFDEDEERHRLTTPIVLQEPFARAKVIETACAADSDSLYHADACQQK